MKKSSANFVLGIIFLLFSEVIFAQGACVYKTASHSAAPVVCVDNVTNVKVCETKPGIDHRFYPGKTCEELRKANSSSTNVSMSRTLNEVVAIARLKKSAQVSLSFKGVDRFISKDLAGATLAYEGSGVATIKADPERKDLFHVLIENPKVRFTDYTLGDSNPELRGRLLEAAASNPKVVQAGMSGHLVLSLDRQSMTLTLSQSRTLQVGLEKGFVQSVGTSVIKLNQSAFVLLGKGDTIHSVLNRK